MTLTRGAGDAEDIDVTIGSKSRAHHVFRRATRARGFEVAAKADAAQLAAPGSVIPACRKARVIGHRKRLAHRAVEVAAVIDRAVCGGVREGIVGDEIAPPQLDRIDAVFGGSLIDQALDCIGDIWAAGTAIGRDRHGVGVDQLLMGEKRRDAVDPAHGDREVARADEGLEVAGVGAEVGLMIPADGQDVVLRIEGDMTGQAQGAAVPFGGEVLRARADPFHRLAEPARGQHQQRLLRRTAAAQTEGSAHIFGNDLDLVAGYAADLRQRAAHAEHALGRRIDRVAIGGGIVGHQAGAQLHRGHRQSLAFHAERGGESGARKGGCHGGFVAGFHKR